MKQITDIIQTFLTFVAFGTFISLGSMWAVNQWTPLTNFEISFWQTSSIFLMFFICAIFVVFIKSILNYNKQ